MARRNNEAKVTFTAQTGEFNNAIKKANTEMSRLQAELRLNAEQMRTTGETAEGLQKRHELLSAQLVSAHDKTEALRKKLEKAKEIFGENSVEAQRLEAQLINAQIAEERIKQSINECNTALANQTSQSGDSRNELQKLTDKIGDQQKELNRLKDEYKNAVLQYGEASTEASNLRNDISRLSGELRENQDRLSEVSSGADELDQSLQNAGDSSDDASGGFTVMKGVIADLASQAIQMAIGKLSEFCSWLAELPEQTRELRQDFATLETAFDNMGFNTETATQTWKELYAVFGEDDRAVETANNITKMADSQKDLNDWVTITTGVWGTYQDSLPVEGLAEASMETAKTGTVTGGLADALNWSSEAAQMFAGYMSDEVVTAEDAFNVALSECNTEQERQQLITDTLTKLYGDAANKYRDTAGAQMEAKEAIAENTLAEAELAETIEPVTTAFTQLKTALLTGVKPAIEAVSAGMLSALDWAKEHPTAMKAIAAAVGVLAVGLTGLAVGVGVYTAAQWAMNSAMLANPAVWIIAAIIAAIALLVAAIVVIVDNWELIKAKTAEVWENIKTAVSNGINAVKTTISNIMTAISTFFTNVWNGIKSGISNAINAIKTAVSTGFNAAKNTITTIWNAIKLGIEIVWNAIKSAVSNAVNAVKTTVSNVFNAVKSTVTSIWNSIKSSIDSVWNGIKSGVSSAVNSVKSTVSNVFNGIKSTATSVWNGIKSAITKPIEEAKNKVKSVIDSIKGFFSGMKLEFPKIKMPHFSVTGKFSLDPPSVPKLGIEWYKDGGIMMKPTIFGMNGNNLMAGGEAGAEAILPIEKLEGYIANVVERSVSVVNLQSLADSIEDLANRPIEFNINGRQFALATASDGDNVNGLRSTFKSRGLVLD